MVSIARLRPAGRDEAPVDQFSVHPDGAGAAFAFAAAFLGSGEAEIFAEDIEEALHGRDIDYLRLAVDVKVIFVMPGPRRAHTVSRSSWVEVFACRGWGAAHALKDVFGEQWDRCEGDAGGVFDGVEDRGCGAVHGQFADALGAGGAMDGGDLLEEEWMGGTSAGWA